MTDERRDPDTPDRPPARAGGVDDTPPATDPADTSMLGAADHDAFWRRSFRDRPYTDEARGYDHYRPAYRYGWESRSRLGEGDFDAVESRLEEGWDAETAGLSWDEARPAVRDAYSRQDNTDTSTPGNPLT